MSVLFGVRPPKRRSATVKYGGTTMRVRLSLATGLIASLALLGACQKEPTAESYADASPPASIETTEVAPLAGGPSPSTQATAAQSADDAYMARLASKGLRAERRIDPNTGKTVLVVFNAPVPNPVLLGGPRYRYASANGRSRTRGAINSGVYAQSSSQGSATRAAAGTAVASSAAVANPAAEAVAPAAETAPATTASVAAGPGVQAIPQAAEPAVQVTDPARAGFDMTPMMWGILGLFVLALLIAIFVANRPKRSRPAFSGHQAPPEASGGEHHGAHA
jgi:hypothetical protein